MIYIFISLIILFFTVVLHIVCYRMTKSNTAVGKLIILLFPVGFIIQVIIQLSLKSPLIINSSIYYISLVLIYLIYFFSFKSGEKSPSAKLFLALSKTKNKKLTKKEIIGLYSSREITDRLDMLINVGIIKKEKDKYKILPKGHIIAELVRLYRIILGWEVGG